MPANLRLHTTLKPVLDVDTLVFIGRRSQLVDDAVVGLLPAGLAAATWKQMVGESDPGDNGSTATTYTGARPAKVVAGVLPEVCSRHNAPSRAWAIPGLSRAGGTKGDVGVVVALDDAEHLYASALAIARGHPSFTAASRPRNHKVQVAFLDNGSPVTTLDRAREGADAVRFAAHLVDMPPNRLHIKLLLETARKLAARLPNTELTVIEGDEVLQAGLGGLWAVGRAASQPPALVVLDHTPDSPEREVGWVGKGIVYDTGGLSMKSKTHMPGMKSDMAGAAAVLAAFAAAVRLRAPVRLTAALALAENAVGPTALRPDDVLKMLSGRTVEVNNTDAEGRLVLADALAWVVRNRTPDEVLDIATLTGAQSMATGKRQGALYCNREELERRACRAGRASGDLVHPLPYIPEFFRKEFSSTVADMKNSVKNRQNAQSSCAGQFIGNHILRYQGGWLHVDMAGPAVLSGRATGFGVGLLLTLLGVGA